MSTANPRYLNVFIVEEFETSGVASTVVLI
jgi:hypothetical protein